MNVIVMSLVVSSQTLMLLDMFVIHTDELNIEKVIKTWNN